MSDGMRASRGNLEQAGVAEHVTILAGDALATLAEVRGPIGLVLLDGWKDLCLPVLRVLEDRLAPAALIVADDTTFESMADYLDYVRDPEADTSPSRSRWRTAWKSAAEPDGSCHLTRYLADSGYLSRKIGLG